MNSQIKAEPASELEPSRKLFSRAACEALDRVARWGQPETFEPLDADALYRLQNRLDSIASLYEAQQSVSPIATSSQRLDHYCKVRSNALRLLNCFDLNAGSKVRDLNIGHLSIGGVFESDNLDSNETLRSLLKLVKECDRLIGLEDGDEDRGRKPSVNLQLLMARLGNLYEETWGGGNVSISVDDAGRGGPAVRFMSDAALPIVGRKLGPNTIANAYRESKRIPADLILY